jgi:hypothetical protein
MRLIVEAPGHAVVPLLLLSTALSVRSIRAHFRLAHARDAMLVDRTADHCVEPSQ